MRSLSPGARCAPATRTAGHRRPDAARESGGPLRTRPGGVPSLKPGGGLGGAMGGADRLLHGAKAGGRDTFWSEAIMPQPIEGFEPTGLRRAYRVPPGFDMPMPPPRDSPG